MLGLSTGSMTSSSSKTVRYPVSQRYALFVTKGEEEALEKI